MIYFQGLQGGIRGIMTPLCINLLQKEASDGVVVVVGVNKVFLLKERLPFSSGPPRKRDVNSPRAAKQFRGDEGIWEATAQTM